MAVVALCATTVVLPGMAGGSTSAGSQHSEHAGINGSHGTVMQPVNMPARITQFASVPGGNEVWALGTMSVKHDGWAPADQLVFMHKRGNAGWEAPEPPLGLGN